MENQAPTTYRVCITRHGKPLYRSSEIMKFHNAEATAKVRLDMWRDTTKSEPTVRIYNSKDHPFQFANEEEDLGACIGCGHSQKCDPEARGKRCENCGEKGVYGADEIKWGTF